MLAQWYRRYIVYKECLQHKFTVQLRFSITLAPYTLEKEGSEGTTESSRGTTHFFLLRICVHGPMLPFGLEFHYKGEGDGLQVFVTFVPFFKTTNISSQVDHVQSCDQILERITDVSLMFKHLGFLVLNHFGTPIQMDGTPDKFVVPSFP